MKAKLCLSLEFCIISFVVRMAFRLKAVVLLRLSSDVRSGNLLLEQSVLK